MISVTDAVKLAGFLVKMVAAIRKFAETQGMSPAEFNRSVATEANRLDAWLQDLISGE
jgi:hypothetical protein